MVYFFHIMKPQEIESVETSNRKNPAFAFALRIRDGVKRAIDGMVRVFTETGDQIMQAGGYLDSIPSEGYIDTFGLQGIVRLPDPRLTARQLRKIF